MQAQYGLATYYCVLLSQLNTLVYQIVPSIQCRRQIIDARDARMSKREREREREPILFFQWTVRGFDEKGRGRWKMSVGG
jgi:hypothetical protein